MDIGTFIQSNWPNLISNAIALVALTISALTFRRQSKGELPSVMVAVHEYTNGPTVAVTVRNRANHPIAVKSISVTSRTDLALASIEKIEKVEGQRILKAAAVGARQINETITLSSSGAQKQTDRMKREYALLSVTGMPEKFWLEVTYDPSDGRVRTKIERRETRMPPAFVGRPTAVPFSDSIQG